MSSTPDARSRDIGTMATLGMYLLLLGGLYFLNASSPPALITPPVRGETVLRLNVNSAPVQAAAPATQPLPEPTPEPEPEPLPAPKPKPVPSPEPKPAPQPRPEPETVDRTMTATPTETASPPPQTNPTTNQSASPAQQTAPVAGSPDGKKREAELIEQILTVLRQRIEQAKHYPFAARKAGITGVVLVQVYIDTSGKITGYSIDNRGQVNARLVSGAEKTMNSLNGICLGEVALPNPLKVEVPIVYQLN